MLSVNDSYFESEIASDDNLYSAVSSVDTPTIIDNNSNLTNYEKSAYGTLTYHINDNISSVKISINISLDQLRYYGAIKISDFLNISASSNNVDVGVVSKNLNEVDNVNTIFATNKYGIMGYTEKAYPNAYGNTIYSGIYRRTNNNLSQYTTYLPYYNKIVYTLYYPEHTTYDSIVSAGVALPEGTTIDVFPDDRKVVVTIYKYNYRHNYGLGVRYKVDNQESGAYDYDKYLAPNNDTIEITYYDGTIKNFDTNSKNYINIVDPATYVNKLKLSNLNANVNVYGLVDDYDDSTFTWAPCFSISNDMADSVTNQTLEYTIDPNFQAVAAVFPKPGASTISNIQYKTNKSDEWMSYNKSITGTVFYKSYVNLDADEYFTAVKATISSYSISYNSAGGAAKALGNTNIYGNLKSDKTSATITLTTYDETDKENTTSSVTDTITHSNDSYVSSSNLENIFSFSNNVVSTGGSVSLSGEFSIYSYLYGNMLYIDNTQIYIREPKGISIDVDNLTLTDHQNHTTVDYTYKVVKNKYDENIYIISTNYRTGRFLTESLITKTLDFSVNININSDCELNSVSINDLLSWGSKTATGVTYIKNDVYDFDGDGIYYDADHKTETVMNVSSKILAIQPSKSVTITTKIIKDNSESLPYNPNNAGTIMNLYSSDTFDYKIKIKNSTDDKINSYILYLPIPKTGYNYGEKFQSEDFSWDMKLSSIPNIPSGYTIEYGINKTRSNTIDLNDIEFKSNISTSELDNVVMIKISSTKQLESGDSDDFDITLATNETKESGLTKLETVNIWNPLSILTSSSISGEFKGNSVATKLLIPELSGLIFEDKNMNNVYDSGVDKFGINATADLYKLTNNEYVKVEGASINVNTETGKYDIDDSNYLSNGTYAIKFNLPNGYKVYNLDSVSMDGWIKNINVTGVPIDNLNVALINYDLGFDIDNQILKVDEETEVSIYNIIPDYFNDVKNDTLAYNFEVNSNFTEDVSIVNNNDGTAAIKGLKPVVNAIIEASIYDKYGSVLTKSINVTVVSDASPKIKADNVSIYLNDKIEFEKYITEAYDYKNNKIELSYEDNANVSFESSIPNDNGIATKVGTYQIKYEVTDSYGNKGSKTIKINVKEKTIIDTIKDVITSPITKDSIITYVLLEIVSIMAIITLIIIKIKMSKNR